jgi:hypothetical protein
MCCQLTCNCNHVMQVRLQGLLQELQLQLEAAAALLAFAGADGAAEA